MDARWRKTNEIHLRRSPQLTHYREIECSLFCNLQLHHNYFHRPNPVYDQPHKQQTWGRLRLVFSTPAAKK